MAEEKLQYSVTFKTRSEGDGAQKTAAAVRDLRTEKERLNALSSVSAQKVGAEAAATYDLSQSISQSTAATKIHYTAAKADDATRARAIQTTRQLREEEAKRVAGLNQMAAAAGTAGTSSRMMGSRIQNTAFQVQDLGVQLQMGTSAATAFAQQLPQLLGGFGAGGAIAGGVVALGALAFKLATAAANTKEAEEALEKYNEQLDDLIAKKADEFVTAYALALDTATERQNDLRDAEVASISTATEVEAANRRKQQAQDDLTLATLRYLQAMDGVDRSAEMAALNRTQMEREAAAATESQNVKLAESQQKFDNIWKRITELKTATEDWKNEIDELNVKAAELSNEKAIADKLGETGRSGDATFALAKVQAQVEEIERRVTASTAEVQSLTNASFRAMQEIDTMRATTTANIGAINAELEAKVGQAEMEQTIAQNQKLTGDLTAALADFQASTPAQAQAAADMAAAVADGKLTAQELAALSGQIVTLGPAFSQAIEANTAQVTNLIALVNDLKAKQQANDAKIADLKNRR